MRDELSDYQAAFLKLVLSVIDHYKLDTPRYVAEQIACCDGLGLIDIAQIWRDVLESFDEAYASATVTLYGHPKRHLKLVQ